MKKVIAVFSVLILLCAVMLSVLGCAQDPFAEESWDVIKATPVSGTFDTEVTYTDGEIRTASGLVYRCDAFDGTTVLVNGETPIGYTAEGLFNYFSVDYYASAPMKLILRYENNNGEEDTQTAYLETGTKTFSSYSVNSGKTDFRKILSLSVAPCKESGAFMLYDFRTEKKDVTDGVAYLKNGRYKIGADLCRGGGLCYFADATLKHMAGINLLNTYDEGRLVQQSYYGTSENDEYTPGFYNNTVWRYNPVQGGDQYGNQSIIIDVVYEEYSVYIKSQPLDWSLNNFLTPSYMESVYTLYPDGMEVDCRFVDFSGWEHKKTTQEVPAFYTATYFNTFSCSENNNSGAVLSKKNLPFWGDVNNAKQCQFFLDKSDETWCTWTHGAKGYGIGLYVPNVDLHFAGMHGDSGEKAEDSVSTSYVAPLVKLQMVSFEPIEYSYRVTTGTVAEMRKKFLADKDFVSNDCFIKE